MAEEDYAYPLPAFRFSVDIDGDEVGFAEVSGLKIELQVIETRNGGDKQLNTYKMPGLPKVENVTLKRGIVKKNNNFYAWLSKTKLNVPERRNVIIKLMDEESNPTMVWSLSQAFPVKIEGPGLKSTGNEVAIETIELAHEGLTIKNE